MLSSDPVNLPWGSLLKDFLKEIYPRVAGGLLPESSSTISSAVSPETSAGILSGFFKGF